MKMASPTGTDTPETPPRVTFSPFGKLKIVISDILPIADVEKFATLIGLKQGRKSDILSKLIPALALLEELEKQDIIRPDDVDCLIEGFRQISHEQLAKIVQEYKEKYAFNSTGGKRYQQSSSRADGDHHSQLSPSEEDHSIDDVTFGVDLFPKNLEQTHCREPIVFCKVGDEPLVVVTARIYKAGTSEEDCAKQLEFLKQKIWPDSLENLDHLIEVVSLLKKLYGATLVKISNDELQLHLSISNENLKKLQTEVRSGELAAALGERFLSIMDIGEEEASSLEFTISIDQESVKLVNDCSMTVHAEKQHWQENPLFCDYCKVICEEKCQHDHHIETDAHKGKLAIKQSRPVWEHREPSSSITNGRFEYCPQYASNGTCRVDCAFAHSTKELREWQERHNHRLEVIENYSKQPVPTSKEYSGEKQRV